MRWGVLAALLLAACDTKTQAVSGYNGTCTACHTNITRAHDKAILGCTECHGGVEPTADQAAAFTRSGAKYGDAAYQQMMDGAHVHPKAGNEAFFLAAGLSGTRGACFNGAVDVDCNAGNPDGLGTIDDAVDSELARDLNYVRFINPGDLRVAHASCGGGAPGSANFGGCHAEEVVRVRRSMMATNASVVTAAFIGNRGRLQSPTGIDGRGYVFDLDGPNGADKCFKQAENKYDSDCLTAHRSYPADDELSANDPGNAPGAFEAFPARLQANPDTKIPSGATSLPHGGHAPRLGGIGGHPVDGAAFDHLDPPDNATNASRLGLNDSSILCAGGTAPATVEPVDAVLRGFRAYYPLWLTGSSKNFNAVAGATLDPDVAAFNPLGRGHGAGCTGCHMLYDNDGRSHEHEQPGGDPTLQLAGRFPSTDLVEGGNKFQQAMNVAQETGDGRKQQRFYPSRHKLTTRIPTRQCGLCHTFVTRIDLAFQGISEVEEGDLLARHKDSAPQSGDITFTTAKGTRVRIYDALERVTKTGVQDGLGNDTFTVATDPRVAQQRALLGAECARRKLDCDAKTLYSADFNNNGELDADEPDFNNGELLLPDRVPRSASVDGRQARILYGGANGAVRLQDVHFEKGMHCVDCHFYQDLHGDGNLYTNNWDAIEIECEDCHGYARKRAFDVNPGKLLTSGASGGNDLLKSKDDLGRPFFEVRTADDGSQHLWQRSRVDPTLSWQVPQLADAASNPPAGQPPTAAPHSDSHIATGPRDPGKLECYACHNTFAMNCLSCHYQQNYKKQQQEVFLGGGTQQSKTDFQLFGMIRSPFILGVGGAVEENRLAPFRSSMEAHVSLADCNGNTVLANVVHANCRDGHPTAGPGTNNMMPHSVRADTARGCESCHTVTDAKGHAVNNHILAQTYGLGTGRLDYLGDWLFVASSGDGKEGVLDVVDIKDESEVPGETGAKNSFPGFVVGNRNDLKAKLRGFGVSDGAKLFAPVDAALLRSYNGALCAGEKPLNPDLALVASGAGGLAVFNVSGPDGKTPAVTTTAPVAVAAGNIVGVDTPGIDVSDPFVYAADASAGLVTIDLSALDGDALAASSSTIDPAGVHKTSGWPAGAPANGLRVIGTTVAVAAGAAGLILVDVTSPAAPVVLGTPLALCLSTEAQPCGRVATRVAVQGAVAYLATSTGLAAVDVHDPRNPKLLAVETGAAAEDVALSGHLAFVAAGAGGLRILDVSDPGAPAPVIGTFVDATGAAVNITQAHGVVVGAVPTQTWAFVADGTSGVRAVNVSTLYDPYRGRIGQAAAPVADAHQALSLERRDPFAPRDATVEVDKFSVVTFATRGSARALARGTGLDRIADESGRRLRDSWNPGNTVLSRAKMDAMRAVTIPLAALSP